MDVEILGRGIAFPPRLGDRNHLRLIDGDAAVRQSMFLIIHTVPGERVMRPEFGCEIHSLIFAPANQQTAPVAERYVRDALARWEPRVELVNVVVTPGESARAELYIEIIYRHREQPDERNLVFPYYLNPQE
jgi:hypothetical protein